MENKKVFIGNLDFEVSEDEVKNLLSKYGTVVSINMHQKKGYAFAEMSDAAEAAKAVQKLDGVKYKEREMRVSIEMKAGKAKSVSVKRYKERGQNLSKERTGGGSDTRSRSEKYRDAPKHRPSDRDRNSGSTYNKPADRSSGYEEKPEGENRKERPGLPRPERDRWATERPSESPRPQKKEWSGDKPSHARPSRDENREGYGGYGRSFEKSLEKSLEKSSERSSGSGNRPLRDYTKERSGVPGSAKREWTPEKPAYKERPSRDGERSGQGRPSRPQKREWTPEKPSNSDRPSRDGEKSGSPRPPRKEWSSDRPSRSSEKTSDSWKEKPEKKEFPGDKPRDYSKPRTVSGSQSRASRSTGPKSGAGAGRGPSGSSRPKARGGAGDRDRNKR